METPLLNEKSIEHLLHGGVAKFVSALVIIDQFFDEQNQKNYKKEYESQFEITIRKQL